MKMNIIIWIVLVQSVEKTASSKISTGTRETPSYIVQHPTYERELNSECLTVRFIQGSTLQYDSGSKSGPENYSTDGTDSGTKLSDFCNSTGNCCKLGNGIITETECSDWSMNPLVSYTLCQDSCLGWSACTSIGKSSADNSVIKIGKGSCSNPNSHGHACKEMAMTTTKQLNLEVQEDSCTPSPFACNVVAKMNPNLESLTIESQACREQSACSGIIHSASSITELVIPSNQCATGNTGNSVCANCGSNSAHTELFQATTACCSVESGTAYVDASCNIILPSDEPSSVPSTLPSNIPSDEPSNVPSSVPSSFPSNIPSDEPSDLPSSPTPPYVEPSSPCANMNCNNAGKCEVTSKTEFKCVCETTFINSTNGRTCVCPPGFVRKSDNRCYDSTTANPTPPSTNSPTLSPIVTKTTDPTTFPSESALDEGCVDDKIAKFSLINIDRSVKCSWLSKNKSRAVERKEKYCGLNRVKTICKSTCSFCTCIDDDSYSFELPNVSNPEKKTKSCDWLTSNRKKHEDRMTKFCTEEFDGGALINACSKSCGIC